MEYDPIGSELFLKKQLQVQQFSSNIEVCSASSKMFFPVLRANVHEIVRPTVNIEPKWKAASCKPTLTLVRCVII